MFNKQELELKIFDDKAEVESLDELEFARYKGVQGCLASCRMNKAQLLR